MNTTMIFDMAKKAAADGSAAVQRVADLMPTSQEQIQVAVIGAAIMDGALSSLLALRPDMQTLYDGARAAAARGAARELDGGRAGMSAPLRENIA